MSEALAVLVMPFLACVLLSAVLGAFGIQVVRREIVFVDIAMAQIAAAGGVAAHLLFEAHEESPVSFSCTLALILGMAAFIATARRRLPQVSLEAVIGVSYAVSAAAVLFMLGLTPGGHLHAQALLSGNLLWTNGADLLRMVSLFAPVGALWWLNRERLTATETRVGWDLLFYLLLGGVIILGVHLAGIVLVFGYLLIPSTAALLGPLRPGSRFAVAWGLGLFGSALGLVLAYRYDVLVGPSIVLAMGTALVCLVLARVLLGGRRATGDP